MIEILKVRYMKRGRWDTFLLSEKQIFPTVEKAREYFKEKLETNKVVLYYAEKI